MRVKSRLILLLLVLFLALGGFFIWWNKGSQPVDASDTSSKIFIIEPGSAVREIGNNLKAEGIIRDPVVFFLYIKKERLDTKLQAGDFRLSPSMSLSTIIDQLQHGSLDIWVTVPEGKRAEEVAEILQKVMPQYDDTWVEVLQANEGYLFPDTYLIPRDANADDVVAIMRNTFFVKVADLGLTAESSELNEIVTMASLIEREAKTNEEKPMVASVLHNRINDAMPLDIDATLQYISGPKNGKWWYPPTGEERTIDSPYNTYRVVGLPPAPIASPGIESMRAAMNPATSEYYFYIHEPNGTVHFARTNAEHNRNVEKYLQ
jgi:UPF0755 protein